MFLLKQWGKPFISNHKKMFMGLKTHYLNSLLRFSESDFFFDIKNRFHPAFLMILSAIKQRVRGRISTVACREFFVLLSACRDFPTNQFPFKDFFLFSVAKMNCDQKIKNKVLPFAASWIIQGLSFRGLSIIQYFSLLATETFIFLKKWTKAKLFSLCVTNFFCLFALITRRNSSSRKSKLANIET